jgi:hypothetical protein
LRVEGSGVRVPEREEGGDAVERVENSRVEGSRMRGEGWE